MKTPILVIGFNRDDLIAQLLERIRNEDRDIYVSIDGPRNETEKLQVDKCKAVCLAFRESNTRVRKIHLRFSEKNLGCKFGVVSAIDWAFESESKLIILEDDITISDNFLSVMDDWLDEYADDKMVFHLNGFSPLPRKNESSYSFLSRYPHVWGWATWRDRWSQYDRHLTNWKEGTLNQLPGLQGQNLPAGFVEYWDAQISMCLAGYDTWDVQWTFSQWLYGGFSLTPGARLTGNLGFDARATHTKNAGNRSRSLLPTNKFDPRKSNRNAYFDHELNAVQDYVEHKLGHLTKESLLKKTLIRVTNPLLLRIVIKIIKFSQGSKTLLIVFRVWIFSKHFVNLKLKIFLKKIFSKIEESAVISYVSILLKFSKKTATFLVIYLPIKGSKFLYWRILRKFLSYFG